MHSAVSGLVKTACLCLFGISNGSFFDNMYYVAHNLMAFEISPENTDKWEAFLPSQDQFFGGLITSQIVVASTMISGTTSENGDGLIISAGALCTCVTVCNQDDSRDVVTCAVQALLQRTFWNWRDAAALCLKEGYSAAVLAHAVLVATEARLAQQAEIYGANNAPIPEHRAPARAIIDALEPYDAASPHFAVGSHQILV